MRIQFGRDNMDRLFARLASAWQAESDRPRLTRMLHELDVRYDLASKAANQRGVAEVVSQMIGRLSDSFERLSEIEGKVILDIACGSTTSRAPALLYLDTPFGSARLGKKSREYAAQFEPWFCRMLLELGTNPVGVDFGDLDDEAFTHYHVDLGQAGALDFLPSLSFDAVQDSRLFGSPEFTAQFPDQVDRLKVAQEIRRQERRLLKADGFIIHSDAAAILK
jgi:hypothetical protein